MVRGKDLPLKFRSDVILGLRSKQMAAKILTDPKQENDFLNHLGLDNLIVLCQKIAKPLHY